MSTPGTTSPRPPRYDAPNLSGGDTLRVVARHDATVERRRFDAGYHEGHAEGYARGAADVDAAIADHRRNAERLAALCHALDSAVAERRGTDEQAVASLESSVLAMAMEIAEAVIGREVVERDVVIESIQHVLRLDRPNGEVTLRLHPDDIGCASEAMDAGIISGADVNLLPDTAIERGGCVVDAGSIRIDGQLGPALARVRSALGLT